MVVYMFTAEHAENTESQDKCEVLGFRFAKFGLLTSDNLQLTTHTFNVISPLSAISGVNVNGNLQNNKSIKIESFKYCEI